MDVILPLMSSLILHLLINLSKLQLLYRVAHLLLGVCTVLGQQRSGCLKFELFFGVVVRILGAGERPFKNLV